MYLKRLELQGFKSFADKTILELKPGITSVIGPNGSGKSNIADAIRWVLGEQSMKSLRGNKALDVIFAGTQNRKSLGFAEASLIFDNTDGGLPIEYSEVTVTRKIYRSGETGYYINKVPCRLKDVLELFMDTGIGKDGYSIVGQGKIDEILSNKSEDRRHVFEEAAEELVYDAMKYINTETANIGSEGIDEFEIAEHEFVMGRRVARDDDTVIYEFTYKVMLEGTSYEYWGRDEDTRDVIRSDGRDHLFEGHIVVEVRREAEIFYDFDTIQHLYNIAVNDDYIWCIANISENSLPSIGLLPLEGENSVVSETTRLREMGLPTEYCVIGKRNNYFCQSQNSLRIYCFSTNLGITNTSYTDIYDYILESLCLEGHMNNDIK